MKKAILLASMLTLAGAAAAQQQPAAFTIVETGEQFSRLADAVQTIGDNAATISIAPGRYRDCAVQQAGMITYAAADPGAAIFDGAVCEGKAALVLRGRGARVEGLVFTNLRVPDGNGAGIRIEQGNLEVSDALFTDSQSGILSANDPSSSISIDHSTFRRLGGYPDGNGSHSLYIGHYGSLSVTNSRFEQGTGGHYVKSRSPVIEVLGSSFDDSGGMNTDYHIDLSNGARGRIAANSFVQGPNKDNYGTIIAVAAEGAENSSSGLVIENNRAWVTPDFRWTTVFVGDWSGDSPIVRNNELGEQIERLEER